MRAFAAFRRGQDGVAAGVAAHAFEEAARLGQPLLPLVRERAVTEQLLGLAANTEQPAAVALRASALPMSLAVLGRFELTVGGRPVHAPAWPGGPAAQVRHRLGWPCARRTGHRGALARGGPLGRAQPVANGAEPAAGHGRRASSTGKARSWPSRGAPGRCPGVLLRSTPGAGSGVKGSRHWPPPWHGAPWPATAATCCPMTGTTTGPKNPASRRSWSCSNFSTSAPLRRPVGATSTRSRRTVERTIEFAPYDDVRYLRAAATLLEQGRRGEALAVVHRARSAFAQLGLGPPRSLLELERSIVA